MSIIKTHLVQSILTFIVLTFKLLIYIYYKTVNLTFKIDQQRRLVIKLIVVKNIP